MVVKVNKVNLHPKNEFNQKCRWKIYDLCEFCKAKTCNSL